MTLNKIIYLILPGTLLLLCSTGVFAQTPIVIGAKNGPDSSWMTKPIPSTVLARKKYTLKRRLYQNLITRFNSYYNAHTKLASILEQARQEHQDDYDSLLTIFPYSPQDFNSMGTNLDSVIFDASYGIEIHDPRSKWMDNLYLITGKAYYFKHDYENAIAAFKYIIKNEGAKNEEGAPKIIGTRGYTSQSQISIATPEKKKLFYHRPSRNDAFIWLIRSYIDSGTYDLANRLINTLKSDPAFPERLQLNLALMESRFYFHQHLYAKGTPFLEQAAALQKDNHLKARWEYMLGQLYERKNNWAKAVGHYRQVTHLPTDPMMNFYAYLKMTELHILQNRENFATGSQSLLKMARKEKYDRYRSIIYYSVARMALKFGLPDKAIPYLQKSLRHNPENTSQKLSSYQLLADTYYHTGKYRPAKMYYDSTAALITAGSPGKELVMLRKDALGEVVGQLDVITRQDSLQRLAAMPPDELKAYLQQIVKDSLKARRKRNLIIRKPALGKNNAAMAVQGNNQASENSRGNSGRQQAWYFYNPALKAKGFSIFRSQWGKRPLADNWRAGKASGQPPGLAANNNVPAIPDSAMQAGKEEREFTGVAALMAGIPLKPEQKRASDDSMMQALYTEAVVFADRLDNDSAAVNIFNLLLTRFPENPFLAEIYYRLNVLYTHSNIPAQAGHYRQMLAEKFPVSKYTAALHHTGQEAPVPAGELTDRLYDSAYINYLSGNYNRVLELKDSATRINPQNRQSARFDLLAAMVTIKQQSDSAGKVALQQVIAREKKDTAIAGQAAAILDALNHKQELIEHLAHLQLPEQTENEQPEILTENTSPVAAAQPHDTLQVQPKPAVSPTPAVPVKKDTAAIAKVPPPKPPATPYKLAAQEPQFVVLAFNHTDKKLIDDCLGKFSAYNQKTHLKDSIEVSSYLLAHNQVVLIFRLFPNEAAALLYYKEIREKAPANIIPDVPQSYYRFFIISRDNFILLNNTKDYQGYLQFFSKNYR